MGLYMKSILYHIIRDELDFHIACADQVQAMPEYRAISNQYDRACRAMDALQGETKKLFLQYESAGNAMASLQEEAAFICGFRMRLHLLTEIFRGLV